VPLAYWTGASWGKAVALSLDRPALAGDFPIARALARRALALDEAFGSGAIHKVMITREALPAAMGATASARAGTTSARFELSGGHAAGPRTRSFAAAVLAACVAAVTVVDAQRSATVRIGTIAPDNSPYVNALREMGGAWKEPTGGRVTAMIYPGGDAAEESMLVDMRPAVRRLHGAQLSAITLGNVDSAFNVFGLPFESHEEADRVLEALRPELQRRLEAKGYKALNFAYVGWVNAFSKKPVATVDTSGHSRCTPRPATTGLRTGTTPTGPFRSIPP
jgi:hypothetical protein